MAAKKTKQTDFEARANKFVAEVDKLQKEYKVGFIIKERTPYFLTVQELAEEAPKK